MEKYKPALEDVQKLANNILLKDEQNHTDYIKDRIDEKLKDLEKRWEGRLQQVKTEIDQVKEFHNNHTDLIREKIDEILEDMENRWKGRLQNLKNKIDQGKKSQQNHTDHIRVRIDEKLTDMEKRWEGRLQNIKTEIDQAKESQQNHTDYISQKVDGKLEDMENKWEGRLQNINTEIDQGKKSKQNHTDHIRVWIDEKLTDMEKRWEVRFQNIKTEIGVLKTAISFTATHPPTRNPQEGDTIIFTRKMHDTAQAYDTGSGKFRAPLAGTYLFNVQLCLEHGKSYLHYSIIAGSRELTQTLLHDYEERFCNSATAIARLAKYDYVYVKVTASITNSLKDEQGERCHFSGVLLNTL
ncbi:uncharacterized protein LOC132738066 [Ruditapes philippinarum]|uniref:uncharacterized protein LOC132738066 n=1 Tax=Ruditapes philippinarum TaxID=129788 RepID=UPI00295B9D83|nr:uncharacterized protein LOC132738066 [Ruditapes philippinarum]